MNLLPVQHGHCDEFALRFLVGLILAACAVGFTALLGLIRNLILRK